MTTKVDLRVKLVSEVPGISEPVRASEGAAGFDLCAAIEEDIRLLPGEQAMVPTGYAWEIPEGHVGLLFLRSGRARSGLSLPNAVGVIDSDFRGEVTCIVKNTGKEDKLIKAGSGIAQMVIVPCPIPELNISNELSDTVRGLGGFGSTSVGQDESADPRSEEDPLSSKNIRAALAMLDHDEDFHWTKGGLPKMEVMEDFLGTEGVDRADINRVAPNFKRGSEL